MLVLEKEQNGERNGLDYLPYELDEVNDSGKLKVTSFDFQWSGESS